MNTGSNSDIGEKADICKFSRNCSTLPLHITESYPHKNLLYEAGRGGSGSGITDSETTSMVYGKDPSTINRHEAENSPIDMQNQSVKRPNKHHLKPCNTKLLNLLATSRVLINICFKRSQPCVCEFKESCFYYLHLLEHVACLSSEYETTERKELNWCDSYHAMKGQLAMLEQVLYYYMNVRAHTLNGRSTPSHKLLDPGNKFLTENTGIARSTHSFSSKVDPKGVAKSDRQKKHFPHSILELRRSTVEGLRAVRKDEFKTKNTINEHMRRERTLAVQEEIRLGIKRIESDSGLMSSYLDLVQARPIRK